LHSRLCLALMQINHGRFVVCAAAKHKAAGGRIRSVLDMLDVERAWRASLWARWLALHICSSCLKEKEELSGQWKHSLHQMRKRGHFGPRHHATPPPVPRAFAPCSSVHSGKTLFGAHVCPCGPAGKPKGFPPLATCLKWPKPAGTAPASACQCILLHPWPSFLHTLTLMWPKLALPHAMVWQWTCCATHHGVVQTEPWALQCVASVQPAVGWQWVPVYKRGCNRTCKHAWVHGTRVLHSPWYAYGTQERIQRDV